MKRLSWLLTLTIIAAALAASTAATAQEADPLADLMENIKSEDAAVRLQALDDLLAMGSEGLDSLLSMLVEPGQRDDAGARFALHGMAARAAQPDEQQLRGRLVAALVAYLDGGHPAEPKRFVIAQLQMIGGPESVPALASALADDVRVAAPIHGDALTLIVARSAHEGIPLEGGGGRRIGGFVLSQGRVSFCFHQPAKVSFR